MTCNYHSCGKGSTWEKPQKLGERYQSRLSKCSLCSEMKMRPPFCVHPLKIISNEEQPFSFTSWAHHQMPSLMLQATSQGLCRRLQIQDAVSLWQPNARSITLSEVLACIWWGGERERREREGGRERERERERPRAGRRAESMLAPVCLSSPLWSS